MEAYNPEKGNDKERFWMVAERMANEILMESFSCVGWRPMLAGSVETSKSCRKRKEISKVVGDLGSLVKDTRSTSKKFCKESLKREQEVLVLAEELEARGSVDGNARAIINRGLKRIKKITDEEETLRELLLEVLDRREQEEEEVWNELEEYSLVRYREETNEYLEHEHLANDPKQCDKGEFGELLH